MLNVQIDRKSIENVSQAVLTCITSDDPMIICMAKHGTEFCNKLPAACAALTHLQIPQYTFGMKLPAAIAACISSEIFIGFCKRRYGAEQCLSWSKKCAIIDYSGNVILTTDAKNCMITRGSLLVNPMALCVTKYGVDFCDKLQMACSEIVGVPILPRKPGTLQQFLGTLGICISTEHVIAMCYARNGVETCTIWMKACSITDISVPLTEEQKLCMKNSEFTFCHQLYVLG
ncbi:unnamed protein product [Anisakis simplex]|uniref:Flavoprotein domain-containing protein n=1 Tax=Anisakis simplex TaxID=6269 RepID=A0A0M3J1W2_ANISI|nr:unnamed protein product [Anisakis simplex]